MTLDPKWEKTVNDGVTNKNWDAYDPLIQREVDGYNKRLAGTPQFQPLDWKMFKAMVWVESGGPTTHAWKTRPMQIGNPGDKGLSALRHSEGAAKLILSDKLQKEIKGSVNHPDLNIRAGIAYALVRLVQSDMQSVDDPKDLVYHEHVVVAGDSLDHIAHQVGSTVASLQNLNPMTHVLHPGEKIKYRKARIQRVLLGWSQCTTANLAARYNVGDLSYQEKLDYVLKLFPKLERK